MVEILISIGKSAQQGIFTVGFVGILGNFTVVCEGPVDAEHFSLEGVNILKSHFSLSRISNVRHHIERLDGVALDEVRHIRIGGGLRIVKGPQSTALIDNQSPPMLVLVGFSASSRKSSKGEIEVGWRGAIHSQELTHFGNRQQLLVRSGCCFPLVGLLGSTMPCSALGVRNFQAPRTRTHVSFGVLISLSPTISHHNARHQRRPPEDHQDGAQQPPQSRHPFSLHISWPVKLHSGPHIPETHKNQIFANVVGQNGPPTALQLHRNVTMTLG